MSPFKKIAGIIVVIMLMWPIAHMILSSQGFFSPWRFFGWGMYATIHPKSNQILIINEVQQYSCSKRQARACSDQVIGSSLIFCSDLRTTQEVAEISRTLQTAYTLGRSFELYSHIPSSGVRSVILSEVLENLGQFNATQIIVDFAKIEIDTNLRSKAIVSKGYSWNAEEKRWAEYCMNEKAS